MAAGAICECKSAWARAAFADGEIVCVGCVARQGSPQEAIERFAETRGCRVRGGCFGRALRCCCEEVPRTVLGQLVRAMAPGHQVGVAGQRVFRVIAVISLAIFFSTPLYLIQRFNI